MYRNKMVYKITKYTYKKAKQLGVKVVPSKNKTKKIDVYKHDKRVASVGAYGMNDFPTFWLNKGEKFAKTRRRLYRIRHKKDRNVRGTNGWYADKLLW